MPSIDRFGTESCGLLKLLFDVSNLLLPRRELGSQIYRKSLPRGTGRCCLHPHLLLVILQFRGEIVPIRLFLCFVLAVAGLPPQLVLPVEGGFRCKGGIPTTFSSLWKSL